MDVLLETTQILSQGAELMKNPAVSGVVTGFFGFMKNIFSNNKRAKERLEMIEKMQANEETIKSLQTNLDDLLYENEDLKKQLEEKLLELQEEFKKAGIAQNITKTNTINVTGNGNINIQDTNANNINLNSK